MRLSGSETANDLLGTQSRIAREKSKRMPSKPKGAQRFLNFHLSKADYNKAVWVAKRRGNLRSQLVYPLVLEYLQSAAHGADWHILRDPDLVANDVYWGTLAEALRPRSLPNGLKRGLAGSTAQALLQQKLTAEQLKHLRDIEKYYRVSISDLVVAAINKA